MDIVAVALILILSVIPLSVVPTRVSRVLYCIVLIIVGIGIQIGGLTFTMFTTPTTYTILSQASQETMVLFLIIIGGSIMALYEALTSSRIEGE